MHLAVRRPAARLLVIGLLGGGATVFTTGVAHADTCETVPPVIDSVHVTPNPVVVSSDYATTVTVTVTAHDQAGTDDCANNFNGGYDASGVGSVTVDLNGQTTWDYVSTSVTQVSGDSLSGTWTATGKINKMNELGTWAADVTVEDNDYNRTENQYASYFKVKHATRISAFNAGPEPARKGKPITVSGKFTKLGQYNGYAAAKGKIVYYFRRGGSTTWSNMGYSYSSASTGRFTKSFTAKASGTWAARFLGAGNYTASNRPTDSVKVVV
jgi:hypothetical protein